MLFIAVAASTATAQEDVETVEVDVDIEEEVVPLTCAERADHIDHPCWFKSVTYHAKSKEDKMADLWGKIVNDPNVVDEVVDFKWAEFPTFFTQKANGSFCQRSDKMQRNRVKTTHTQGVVAQVEYRATADNSYTGILGSGSDQVVMRLSESNNLTALSEGLTPSIALKFLVDGTHSRNILGMSSFMNSQSWNFLEPSLSNSVKAFDVTDEVQNIMDQTLRKKMVEGSKTPFALAISHVARIETTGEELADENVRVPYKLEFVSPLKDQFSSEKSFDSEGNQVMWYDQLKTIKAGQTIYDVMAWESPEALGGSLIKIGEIVLKTDLFTSQWADEELYFQHRQHYQDRMLWPWEWRKLREDQKFERVEENIWGFEVPTGEGLGWPSVPQEAEQRYIDQVATYGCPFAWLIGMN